MDHATDIELFEKALVRLDRKLTRKVFDDSGLSSLQFSDQIIVPVLDRLGHKWEVGTSPCPRST